MTKRTIRRIGGMALGTLAVLCLVLGVHIYLMTHRPADPNRVAMARIDVQQALDEDAAADITQWLYAQQGVEHVLCNPVSRIAVFSYYPARVDANELAARFNRESGYAGKRYVPDAKELMKGCPLAEGGVSARITQMYNKIIHF